MIKLPSCDLELFWCQSASSGGGRGAGGGDMMGYVVFHGLLCVTGLGYSWKFSEKILKGAL